MKNSPLNTAARWVVCLVAGAMLLPCAKGATVWDGPSISFTNLTGSDPTLPENQDRLTPDVWLTRGAFQGIYNIRTEPSFVHFVSPADTEWADGTTANYASLTYTDWNTWAKVLHPGPPSTVGVNAVVHLISEDIYLDLKFTSWPIGSSFAYTRSTPKAGSSPPVLTGAALSNNDAFQLTFTNAPGLTFSVLSTTNLSLPLTDWDVLGQVTEEPEGSGLYLFVDPIAGTNRPQKFYKVRRP